jgi:FHS family L-fucose permease-like MFS transporter
MIGRFIGAYLTKSIKPGKVLAFFALMVIALILLSIYTNGLVSMWSILAVGLFNSIMFPTIFTLAIDGIGDLKPKASGLLCTAIVGGALIPPFFGYLSDIIAFKNALLFIVACYTYIVWFGYRNIKP